MVKTIFFDLDETIWDYRSNAEDTLSELYHIHNLDRFFSLPEFIIQFFTVNKELWDLFDRMEITKSVIREKRFPMVMERLQVENDALGLTIQDQFVELCPKKKKIIPQADVVIQQLSKRYKMYIITNGFEGIQTGKLKAAGVLEYFDHVITSEAAGAQKPDAQIFSYALQKAKALPSESLMIGDNLVTDIMGARNAGLEAIYFNPARDKHNKSIEHEIHHLSELLDILL